MKTERGNSACYLYQCLLLEDSLQHQQVKVIRKQLGPLQLALPIYSPSSLGQVASCHWEFLSRVPVTISEERFEEFLGGKLY